MELNYYPGCTSHSTAWELDQSTRGLCDAMEITLIELEGWNCCGGASAKALDDGLGVGLPLRNVELAVGSGKNIFAPCAGCYNNLARSSQASQFELDYSIWSLLNLIEADNFLERVADRADDTWKGINMAAYYGCQLVRPVSVTGRADYENPTTLERAIAAAGATPVDWSEKTDCCGADLGITHSSRAAEICSTLAERAAEAGADALVVGCGLCQANLDLRQTTTALPVLYITEVLGLAIGLSGSNKWFKKHLIDPANLLNGASSGGTSNE